MKNKTKAIIFSLLAIFISLALAHIAQYYSGHGIVIWWYAMMSFIFGVGGVIGILYSLVEIKD